MIRDIMSAADSHKPSKLDVLEPEIRVAASMLAALAISQLRSPQGLVAGSLLPLTLMFMDGRDAAISSVRILAGVNKVSLFAWILLPLTYPGERALSVFSVPGVCMAVAVTWKLNLISMIIIRFTAALGIREINEALGALKIPLKMRMLLVLTARYILLLFERMSAMIRAVRQRSPGSGFMIPLRAAACMTGTTLIHSMDRAERSLKAFQRRGGMGGFASEKTARRTWLDSLTLVLLALYLASVLTVDFLWR